MKIPLQTDILEYAIMGLLRRAPDERAPKAAFDASHTVLDLRYKIPMGQRKTYLEYASRIRAWLDHFDVQLSGTRVEVGAPLPKGRHAEVLQIKISVSPLHAGHL